MKVLLSNDDGYLAKGINVLFDHLLYKKYDVTISAPDRDVSGCSSALTLRHTISSQMIRENVYKVEGTAADAAHLAINGMFEEPFDLIVSGINAGCNLSDDIWYSGTIGAGLEGRFLKNAPVAVSLMDSERKFAFYQTAAEVVSYFLEGKFYAKHRYKKILFNINVPSVPFKKIQGFKITMPAKRTSTHPILTIQDPKGRPAHWVGPTGPILDQAEEKVLTDAQALDHGFVSITPISLNMLHLADPELLGLSFS